MSFESGGIANKLGNYYEGRWVVNQLLSLLNEKINSVTVEAIGDDEKGVDLWIESKQGIRQAHQCKARNASKEYWNINDLASRKILNHLQCQLTRDPNYEFVFVSSVGSELFNDICSYARRSGNNPNAFYQKKILKSGDKTRECFSKFCAHLSLNPDCDTDRAKAFDYLKRTYITVYSDDLGTWQSLLDLADYLLIGDPETIVSTLLAYAENNDRLGAVIYADELRHYLSKKEIHPKRLDHDSRITNVIPELKRQFDESIAPYLINGSSIDRTETSLLIEAITNGKNVILSGPAGHGKSGVLFELTEYLDKNNIPFLPIRLDRRDPENNASHFGKQMGLPDCPVYSLNEIAGKRESVFIIDQLDAIRWTSANSKNALDVCKELKRHADLLRQNGDKITMVLSCRAFDLDHDPEIQNWLNKDETEEFVRIDVKKLATDKMQQIVGASFLNMNEKEKKLLSNPFNLSIWIQLRDAGSIPSFQTVNDLLGKFWKNRRYTLENEAGITSDAINQVIDPLVDYMDLHGKLSAPERIVSQFPKTAEALISYDILHNSAGKTSFSHQRYMDFMIVHKLLKQIDKGDGDILSWLDGKEKQSLFRREHLRQFLVMLSEESPQKFFKNARQILKSKKVRFHIKHLILELIGSLEKITDELLEYCITLFHDEFWHEHIFESVFWGHPVFLQLLHDKGVTGQWLDSKNSNENNRMLLLIRSVAEEKPNLVADILGPYVENGLISHQRIHDSISFQIENDSERMFELRLKLIRLGIKPHSVHWKTLCAKYPLRAIRLIETTMSIQHINEEKLKKSQRNRLENWHHIYRKALKEVAIKYPVEVWDNFIPHIKRLTDFNADSLNPDYKKWRDRKKDVSGGNIELEHGVFEMTTLAGKEMAENQSNFLIARASHLEASASLVIQEILMEVYGHLPPAYADIGIKWILDDTSRFHMGSGFNEPKWKSAANLIEKLSPNCSDLLFHKLEQAIIHYHSPNERQNAEYYLKRWKDGYFGHYWGKAQYFLLPALPAERTKSSTKNLIRVLNRKFLNYSEFRFLRIPYSQGGWVSSKLNPSLEKISDRAWQKIITSKKVGKDDNHKWIQADSDTVLTTSIRHFSDSLRTMTKRQPERFGQLALQFPNDVDPHYIVAILDGCSQKKPESKLSDQEKELWKPAKTNTIENILKKFKADDDQETAISFCSLIQALPERKWSNEILARLIHYAQKHPTPETEKINYDYKKSADEASVDALFQNGISCVRSLAASAIQHLLRENTALLEKLRPGIEALVRDHHPSVRMAAIEALLPLLSVDKNKSHAVEWFLIACEKDLRVAASPEVIQFYYSIIPSHLDRVTPIIKKTINSSWDDVAKEGARQVAVLWLYYGCFEEELLRCQSGTKPQRQGIAKVCSQLFHEASFSDSCQKILSPLLNDQEKDVRDEIQNLFHQKDTFNNPKLKPFILEYIKSEKFVDAPSEFIWSIKDYTGSIFFLKDVIFNMCEIFASTLKKRSNDSGMGLVHDIPEVISLLLRLYDESLADEKTEIADRCLDIWDILFENRVGMVRNLTKAIEG